LAHLSDSFILDIGLIGFFIVTFSETSSAISTRVTSSTHRWAREFSRCSWAGIFFQSSACCSAEFDSKQSSLCVIWHYML